MFEFDPARTVSTVEQLRPYDQDCELVKVRGNERPSKFEDQFCVFQFNPDREGMTLVEPTQVKPSLRGSQDRPDVYAGLQMLSFHVGQNEAIEKDTLATMRLNFGKDENSSDKLFDTVFWSIAAGLKLYDAANSGKTSASDLNFSSNNAFANRPIEIPGGIGSLSFEVVKHSEPKWYQRIFRFLGGNAGATLVSLLGFPAVSIHGIRAIDELLERLKHEPPLFESSPLRFAMSGFSRDEFTGGDQNVKIGVLAKGYNVFARGRDIERFNNQPMTYYAHLNRLAPRDASESNVLANQFDDPLADVTYAIFKVGLAETKLDPTFDFRNG